MRRLPAALLASIALLAGGCYGTSVDHESAGNRSVEVQGNFTGTIVLRYRSACQRTDWYWYWWWYEVPSVAIESRSDHVEAFDESVIAVWCEDQAVDVAYAGQVRRYWPDEHGKVLIAWDDFAPHAPQ